MPVWCPAFEVRSARCALIIEADHVLPPLKKENHWTHASTGGQVAVMIKSAVNAILIVVLVTVYASENSAAAPADKPVAFAVRGVMDAQQAAWNRGDIDGFMSGYSNSSTTVFVSGDTVTRGWKTVRDRYRKKYSTAEKMGRLSFWDLEIVSLCRDTAIVLGRWELKRPADHPHGRFTLLFRRMPDGWRIVLDHTS
jgi:ketosteroid isomerase-like protein